MERLLVGTLGFILGWALFVMPAPATAGSVPATLESLDGRNFVSTSIKGPGMKPKRIKLSFFRGVVYDENWEIVDPNGPIMAAQPGCNFMSAGYQVLNGRLRWTPPVVSTLVGCTPDRDLWLALRLSGGMKAFMEGNALLLQGKRGVHIRLKPRG